MHLHQVQLGFYSTWLHFTIAKTADFAVDRIIAVVRITFLIKEVVIGLYLFFSRVPPE